MILRFWSLLLLLIIACNPKPEKETIPSLPVIVFQPFKGTNEGLSLRVTEFIASRMENPYLLKSQMDLPINAYVGIRGRFSADSLIACLKRGAGKQTKMVGLIGSDMETQLPRKPHWGVIGLAYCPGASAIISTFRLKKQNTGEKVLFNRLVTVCLHEMGHCFSIPHCKSRFCLMRDAKGGLPSETIGEFCPECLQQLTFNGWKYHQPPTTYSQHTENKEKNPG